MASIPCLKTESQCNPCAGDSSNPLANLSSEAPDSLIWTSVQFRRVVNVIPNVWKRDTCVGFCESSLSQTDADDCAERKAVECIPDPPFTDPPPFEPPSSPLLFCNQEIAAQSGSSCYTIPACTVFASSQGEANAIAQSLANSRVFNPALSTPCAPIVPPGPGPDPEPPTGPTIAYEKAWNEPLRGAWSESDPCPWPNDYSSTWLSTDDPENPVVCLCNGDNNDGYQWPFGEGSPSSPGSAVTQSFDVLDASIDSILLTDTPTVVNAGSTERLYLRTRVEGGVTGKHVMLQGHWTKPGGSWQQGAFNESTLEFDYTTVESYLKLEFNYDPCAVFQFSGTPQVLEISAIPASGDLTYEFDVPPGGIYYACVWFESRTHSNGPSTLHLETTITDL